MEEPSVIYEDKKFLAVNKPAGLLVHAVRSKKFKAEEPTLVEWLLKRYPEIQGVGDDPELRPGIVHRLDRETSGIMIVTRTKESFSHLKQLFFSRQIQKTYLALALGKIEPKEGVIEKPIRIKKGSVKRTVYRGRDEKEARTTYKVKEYFKNTSLLEVVPLTGRTHQIRVHLQSVGHSICGDKLYSPKNKTEGWSRLMLHALSLEFSVDNGNTLKLEAEPPRDFVTIIHNLEHQ